MILPGNAAPVWNCYLRINTAVPLIGLAALHFHTFVAGGGVGVQVNWPPNMIVPLVVTNQGPPPAPEIPFPMVSNWLWEGAAGGPVINIIAHMNDYHMNAVAGFQFAANNIQNNLQGPYHDLLIINQLQSALLFQ